MTAIPDRHHDPRRMAGRPARSPAGITALVLGTGEISSAWQQRRRRD